MKRTKCTKCIVCWLVGVVFWLHVLQSAATEAEYTYIYNAPESSLDNRYIYQWKVLQTALEKTSQKYGSYRMLPSAPMTERRQMEEMLSGSGKINVMYVSFEPRFDKSLILIHIPVDRNLVGYRVFLIRKEDAPKFEQVHTLDDLRKFTYGMGLGWNDVDILRYNHFKVVTGSSYDGLFQMLANKRFDVFLRGAVEVLGEYEERKSKIPDLFIEKHLLLYYPMPMYFGFPKNAQGKKLAQRAEEGMRMMLQDGSYDRLFNEYQGDKISQLKLKERRLFSIASPFVDMKTEAKDRRLWLFLDGNKN